MKKGCGPRNLGSPNKMYKSPAKMKDLSGDGKITKKDVLIGRGVIESPAKQIIGRNLADAADKKRAKAEKAEAKGKTKRAERLRNKASKLDKKHVQKAFKNVL